MSIIKCRECFQEVSSKAERCPGCGIIIPGKMKHIGSIVGNTLGVIIGLVVIIVMLANGKDDKKIVNSAQCELLSHQLKKEFFVINDEPDAGYVATITIINQGYKGNITSHVVLSTSEGQYIRKQTLLFDKHETKKLSFQFHEPTIYATNIQARYSCNS